MDLPVIKLVQSKGMATVGDCGICAIGTICDKTYEDVVAVAVRLLGEQWKKGLWLTQIIAITAEFGVKLKRRRKYDLESDTGLLNCTVTEHLPNKKPSTAYHIVVLMEGKIYDSDLRIWSVDAFTSHYSAEFGELLEIV